VFTDNADGGAKSVDITVFTAVFKCCPDFRLFYNVKYRGFSRDTIDGTDASVRTSSGHRIPVHKNILSAAGDYFKDIFASGVDSIDWSEHSYGSALSYLDMLYSPVKRLRLFYLEDFMDVYRISSKVGVSHDQVRMALITKCYLSDNVAALINVFKFLHKNADVELQRLLSVHLQSLFEYRDDQQKDGYEYRRLFEESDGDDEGAEAHDSCDCGCNPPKCPDDFDQFSSFVIFANRFYNLGCRVLTRE
jgi:hypothetical protein